MAETVEERDYRRAWVIITDQALLDALPVPKDAHLIAIRQPRESAMVELLLESGAYNVVPEGSVGPRVAASEEEEVPEEEDSAADA